MRCADGDGESTGTVGGITCGRWPPGLALPVDIAGAEHPCGNEQHQEHHTVRPGSNNACDDNTRCRPLADRHIAVVLDDLHISHELLSVDGHDAAISYATDFALIQGIDGGTTAVCLGR